jgi:EmrB/QacA subfamily drug resistance transporter
MRPANRRRDVLWGVLPGVALVSLSGTILDIPRADVIDALDTDRYRILWIAGSYLVGSAAGMTWTGMAAELVGLRRAFVGALVLFTAAGSLCGLVSEVVVMAPLRLLQGVGAGLVLSPGMVLVWREYPDRRELAMAGYGIGVYLAAIVGAVLGGVLATYGTWQWLFWINLPLGGVFTLLALRLLPAEPAPPKGSTHFDVAGFLLFLAWVVALNVTLDWGQYWGWVNSPVFASWLALLVVAFAGFLVWGVAHARPLIGLRPFAHWNFAVGILAKSLFAINLTVQVGLTTAYMVNLRGYQWWQASLVVLPALPAFVVGALGHLRWHSPGNRRLRIIPGLALMTACTACLSAVDLYTSKYWLAALFGAWGVGVGLAAAPLLAVIFDGLTPAETLQGAGIFNIARALPSFAVGTLLVTLLTRQTDYQFDRLRQRVTRNRPLVTATVSRSEQYFIDRGSAGLRSASQAHALLGRWVHANARAYAFEQVFAILALATAMGIPVICCVRQPPFRPDTSP